MSVLDNDQRTRNNVETGERDNDSELGADGSFARSTNIEVNDDDYDVNLLSSKKPI